ncbi:MAG: hypothetical protein FD180_315 [Planctomycetota bacterium]|nr:MAG: hypothetical protein FD180_315 [Planctomycetota bacterium]
MNFAVFLRGANVGGARVFKPAALARELGVENIGAAGTFVARNRPSAAAVKKEFADALPIETEIIVVAAAEIAALVKREPFRKLPPGAKPVVTFLAAKPKLKTSFPLDVPKGPKWEVRLLGTEGAFVPGCYRVLGKLGHYPNEVVEKALGVPATTRSWGTVVKVSELLEKP